MKFIKILMIASFALLAGTLLYFSFKPKTPEYKTAKAVYGPIAEEISESGTIKKGETVNLNFKNPGLVTAINVTSGQKVEPGQVLAELDSNQLKIQLEQARANLALYQIQMEKLLNGAGAEDVNIARSAVENARSASDSASQALADAKEVAAKKLNSVYKSASDALSSASAKAYNAQNFAGLVQRTYFEPRDEDSISVWQTYQKINLAAGKMKDDFDAAQASPKSEYLDRALATALEQLAVIDSGLQSIRAICEKSAWRDTVSQADKNSLDLQRDYIVAALASVNSARENINLQKTANEAAVNTAQAAATGAQGALKTARDQLEKTIAGPRQEDKGVLNAQIVQARAQVSLLELQISDSQLKAPVGGQVLEVNARVGETVQPLAAASGIISLLPDDPYVVEADIYEEDIAKAQIGNAATITPTATPDNVYSGKLVFIDPADKVVNGVVYYTAKVAFDEVPTGLKPGMTADIVIIAKSQQNALLVPEGAVEKTGSGYQVKVLRAGSIEDASVTVGIRSKGQAQITSGLNEGDEVVVP